MNSVIIDCLMRFSREKLVHYLGEDLVEQTLSEWDIETLTKRKMAEMLIRLNLPSLFSDPNFRKELLEHLHTVRPNDIDSIFDELPATRKKNCQSVTDKINAIVGSSWNESPANNKFLSLFGFNNSVFDTSELDTTCITYHESSKRFYELLDYQFVIKQRVLNELNKTNELKRMLVHMPTGTGKTKTMMHTLVHYYNFSLSGDGLIIWLAHTTELLQQAYDTFSAVWNHLGQGEIKTYKLWGNRVIPTSEAELKGVMFCGIQKLQSIKQSNSKLFQQIVNKVNLVVFDEAHKAAATETRQTVESLMIKLPGMHDRSLVGLTATPGRSTLSNDENKLLSNMFENRIISIDVGVVNQVNLSSLEYLNQENEDNIIHYFQNKQILSRIKKEQLTYQEDFTESELRLIKTSMTQNGYVDFNKKALQVIGQKRQRNNAIMKKLRELSVENIPTIVFACSVAHAKLLSFMLSLENIPNGIVLGEMSPSDRGDTIQAFKDRNNPLNILINYEVLTTGFDSTNIGCVFITRPTQSIVLYSQMLGRGLRGPMMGGNPTCLLVDIKDNLGRFDAEMAFNHFDTYWN